MSSFGTINDSCPPAAEDGMVPLTCPLACAVKFVPFWRHCGRMGALLQVRTPIPS